MTSNYNPPAFRERGAPKLPYPLLLLKDFLCTSKRTGRRAQWTQCAGQAGITHPLREEMSRAVISLHRHGLGSGLSGISCGAAYDKKRAGLLRLSGDEVAYVLT
jgi:hypothetical protein